ncbi:indole-3-glycerol-phosphate synthase [Streptomyces clavuligerus]|uniref:indole-3-glycerol-phosphate synthase n=1 Tax=Streptomyces clavuligerus TaxID=1901 RepID=D5SLI7_STRCL|nr:indole-3-glycerol-phosphate synthase [Streptomyces clavuligerus]EFG04780.1 Indole-3-glycerol-phosphate synthase [Streptomyces clavuligerus]MBY6306772.1 indole-3-glycerol-phosphate synthase [Streptomyces clavuligerus]QCS10625.1 indole-3-glycerol phosphate synthase [Streptomyces clavuligerus]QPJ97337.1 indole-3-glycerol-phosphate synthase [Streptomyces clavuligerus]WDN57335.1 indole-3-glycerol-phosphate synthase [Streptomyces clavuligerus]
MTAPFIEALLTARRPVIMELKPRDADGRDLFAGRSAARLATAYRDAGAPCLSVVTGHWFGGTPELLREVADHTDLPLLHKDFLTRRSQLDESRAAGASAVLLTAALLPRSTLGGLVEHALGLGLTPFVEVTREAEISRVPHAEECAIAVNNKDITARERGAGDLGRSYALLPAVQDSGTRCPVSASGIHRPEAAARLLREGFAGVLVGTGLLSTESLPEWLAAFDRQLEGMT